MTVVASIVEGHGEQQAVQRLLRRIAADAAPQALLRVNEPIRVKSGSFVNDPGYFSRYVNLAAAKARQEIAGHVLILLDCEDECPARFGPKLLGQARAIAPDVNIIVALAYREYETWFMAAVESLRGVEGMSGAVLRPADPEATRNAKGWLGRHMPHGYDPISHQLAFTSVFDLDAGRTVASFDRLYRKIASLLIPVE
ncbi:MAG: DUF4276 family protein [Rubrivivax sp.]|nr:DUF4276 family protein [Rubrivivax sp.]